MGGTGSYPELLVACCGFVVGIHVRGRHEVVVLTVDEVVVAMYGDEELINSFRDALTSSYSGAVINFDEAIQ